MEFSLIFKFKNEQKYGIDAAQKVVYWTRL